MGDKQRENNPIKSVLPRWWVEAWKNIFPFFCHDSAFGGGKHCHWSTVSCGCSVWLGSDYWKGQSVIYIVHISNCSVTPSHPLDGDIVILRTSHI